MNVHVINEICILLLTNVETMLQKKIHGGIIEKKNKLFNSNALLSLVYSWLPHGRIFCNSKIVCAPKCFNNPKTSI